MVLVQKGHNGAFSGYYLGLECVLNFFLFSVFLT